MTSDELPSGPEAPPQAPRGPMARSWRGAHAAARRRPWSLLFPALATRGLLLVWPLGRVVWLSFQDYGLRELNRGTTNFVGLDNYTEIFSSSYLYTVVLPNTIGFAFACVTLTLVLGTLIALFLRTLPKFWRYLTSTAVMIAWAVPAITGTYVWAFIFEPANGLATNLRSEEHTSELQSRGHL